MRIRAERTDLVTVVTPDRPERHNSPDGRRREALLAAMEEAGFGPIPASASQPPDWAW